MGGKLLTKEFGLPEKRIPRAEFEKLANFTRSKLCPRRTEITRAFEEKQTFGDLDILVEVKRGELKLNWLEYFKAIFKVDKVHRNGSVYSLPIDGFQCDFILTEANVFECTADYYAYESGNIMGVISKQLGLLYGHRGLYLDIPLNYFNENLPNHEFCQILITRDSKRIFGILGFNYLDFKCGFRDFEELFEWARSSHYFTPEIFAFDALNSVNRTRNRKRPFYSEFVEKCAGITEQQKLPSKEFVRKLLIELHPHLSIEIEKNRKEIQARTQRRLKFNGNIVKEVHGIEGKKLGEFIIAFRKQFPNFEEWLDANSAEDILKTIQNMIVV